MLEQLGEGVSRLRVGAAPGHLRLVDERRGPQQEVLAAEGGAILIDDLEGGAGQPFGMLPRVGDGRRAEHELGVGAVESADAPEPADDVGDVGAEDAAVDVGLVEDDVAKAAEKGPPHVSVGQDAQVQHVRVREHDVGGPADLAPLLLGGIAVVGGVPRGDGKALAKLAQLAKLVLGQGLGGVEVQGAAALALQQRLQDRHVVAQALAAGGRGGDDDVGAIPQGIDGLGLVLVEGEEAQSLELALQCGMKRALKVAVPGIPWRDGLGMDDLVSVPGLGLNVAEEGFRVHRLNLGSAEGVQPPLPGDWGVSPSHYYASPPLPVERERGTQGVRVLHPLWPVQDLHLVVQELEVASDPLQIPDGVGDHGVGVAAIIAHAADAESDGLPLVQVIHFGHGDVELLPEPGGDRAGGPGASPSGCRSPAGGGLSWKHRCAWRPHYSGCGRARRPFLVQHCMFATVTLNPST